jgi:hypothetical protein
MKAKHTPGPWQVDGTVALGVYGVWTKDADPRNPGHDGAGYQVQICSMLPMGREAPIGREERGANARLIAESPALYQAWKDYLAALDGGGLPGVEMAHAIGDAREAIARIESDKID